MTYYTEECGCVPFGVWLPFGSRLKPRFSAQPHEFASQDMQHGRLGCSSSTSGGISSPSHYT